MRVQRVEVGYSSLLGLLAGNKDRYQKLWSNLPDDARLIEVRPSKRVEMLALYIESSTFDDIPEGYLVPDFPITVTVQIETLKEHIEAILGDER